MTNRVIHNYLYRVLLTDTSDQVEVQALKPSQQPINSNRKRYNRKIEFGDGWFSWRDLKVNADTITQYEGYINDLQDKHGLDQVRSIQKEKTLDPSNKHLNTLLQFYIQILSKTDILTNHYNLPIGDAIDFIRTRHRRKENEFTEYCNEVFNSGDLVIPEELALEKYLSQDTIRKLSNPDVPRNRDIIQPLSDDLIQKMIAMKNVVSLPDVRKQELGIKEEFASDPYSFGTSVAVIDQASVQVINQEEVIGDGDVCVQFFYENPVDGSKVAFKPVMVRDDGDIKAVMSLCGERAAEYKYKCGHIDKPTMYYSEVVRAKTRLDPKVVSYIRYLYIFSGGLGLIDLFLSLILTHVKTFTDFLDFATTKLLCKFVKLPAGIRTTFHMIYIATSYQLR